MRAKRLFCWLFGCVLWDYDADECYRCGTECYSPDFIQGRGLWGAIRKIYWPAWRRLNRCAWLVRHECGGCLKKMWFTREKVCSAECFDRYIPF